MGSNFKSIYILSKKSALRHSGWRSAREFAAREFMNDFSVCDSCPFSSSTAFRALFAQILLEWEIGYLLLPLKVFLSIPPDTLVLPRSRYLVARYMVARLVSCGLLVVNSYFLRRLL
jgi:hypothetical protein